jgi:hypothetical protein
VALPDPIPFASNCHLAIGDPVFEIGFPSTVDRTHPRSLPIEDKNIDTKRWSKGLYVHRYFDGTDVNQQMYVGTTTDSLVGNSGGPILNSAGEVVSVVIRAAATERNQYRYDGSEQTGVLDWQTLGSRCELLIDIRDQLSKL